MMTANEAKMLARSVLATNQDLITKTFAYNQSEIPINVATYKYDSNTFIFVKGKFPSTIISVSVIHQVDDEFIEFYFDEIGNLITPYLNLMCDKNLNNYVELEGKRNSSEIQMQLFKWMHFLESLGLDYQTAEPPNLFEFNIDIKITLFIPDIIDHTRDGSSSSGIHICLFEPPGDGSSIIDVEDAQNAIAELDKQGYFCSAFFPTTKLNSKNEIVPTLLKDNYLYRKGNEYILSKTIPDSIQIEETSRNSSKRLNKYIYPRTLIDNVNTWGETFIY